MQENKGRLVCTEQRLDLLPDVRVRGFRKRDYLDRAKRALQRFEGRHVEGQVGRNHVLDSFLLSLELRGENHHAEDVLVLLSDADVLDVVSAQRDHRVELENADYLVNGQRGLALIQKHFFLIEVQRSLHALPEVVVHVTFCSLIHDVYVHQIFVIEGRVLLLRCQLTLVLA